MKILTVLCALAVGLYFVLLTYFVEHGNMLTEFFAATAGFVVLILMLISAVGVKISFQKKNLLASVPFLICFFGLPVGFCGAISVGESIKAANFQKNLPRYNEAVNLIAKGEIESDSDGQIQLPEQFSDLAFSVYSHTDKDERTIIFVTDEAFPLWRSSYIYTSSGVPNKFIKGRNCIEQVNTNWFYVSD
jgi:hypothetical protein